MKYDASAVHVFNTHSEAEQAVRALNKAGLDVTKLSIVGRGYHSEERPVGFYTLGDRIKSWGGVGAFWGGIWGLLLAPAIFFIPGLGLVGLAGPVVSALVGALEGAVVVGGISALGVALTHFGMPKEDVIRYETALNADKYLLLVHGDAKEMDLAQSVLGKAEQFMSA